MAVKDFKDYVKNLCSDLGTKNDSAEGWDDYINFQKEIVDDCVTEDVKATKHDKIIKICSEIIAIRKKLGFVPMADLAAIVGKEFFSNDTTSLFSVPGDKRYIEALRILNNISLIVNTTFGLEELVKLVEDQFDRLDTIAIADGSFDEDKQFNLVLEYLYSIKKSNLSKSISYNELLKAFVIGNVIDNGSDFIFIPGESVKRFLDFINAENFDIKDKDQVCACKCFLRSIKQTVLLNKENNNKISRFMMSMANVEHASDSSPISQKSPAIQEIDQKIYKKAAAFDKLVEALRPIFDELTN